MIFRKAPNRLFYFGSFGPHSPHRHLGGPWTPPVHRRTRLQRLIIAPNAPQKADPQNGQFGCSRFAKPVRSVPVPSSVGLRRRPASADPNSQSPNPHRPASSDLSVSNPIPATTPHHHPGPLSNPAPAHGRRRVDPRRSRRSPSHEATRVVPETSRLCAPTALSFHPNASPLT